MTEVKNSTLCYIRNNGRYLMLHRIFKEGDINLGKWIGVGGHFEEGESPEACMLREVREETGFVLTGWQFRGVVTFVNEHDLPDGGIKKQVEYMYLFTADGAEGGFDTPLPECDEGVLSWVEEDKVPTLECWEGDRIFLDLIAKESPVFLLTLKYKNEDALTEAFLNGERLPVGG